MTTPTAFDPSRRRAVRLDGELTFEHGGTDLILLAVGNRLELRLPPGHRRDHEQEARLLQQVVVPVLERSGLRLEVKQGGRLMATLGPNVDSPVGGILLGNRRIRPSLTAIVRAGAQRTLPPARGAGIVVVAASLFAHAYRRTRR